MVRSQASLVVDVVLPGHVLKMDILQRCSGSTGCRKMLLAKVEELAASKETRL